jgi:hypothetical protein
MLYNGSGLCRNYSCHFRREVTPEARASSGFRIPTIVKPHTRERDTRACPHLSPPPDAERDGQSQQHGPHNQPTHGRNPPGMEEPHHRWCRAGGGGLRGGRGRGRGGAEGVVPRAGVDGRPIIARRAVGAVEPLRGRLARAARCHAGSRLEVPELPGWGRGIGQLSGSGDAVTVGA